MLKGGESPPTICEVVANDDPQTFFDDFSASSLDQCRWIILHEAWGAEDGNGGVIPANVEVDNGLAKLTALGDLYIGAKRGIDANGRRRLNGRRAGAAIMTRRRFGGGRFEARVRIAPVLGVCSAMWTYRKRVSKDGTVLNHEIDIEFPGHRDAKSPPSLDFVGLTTWTGLDPEQKSSASIRTLQQLDKFLTLRFDWYPPAGATEGTYSTTGRVEFYINDRLVHVSRRNIPTEPAPLLLGVWFPKAWAGQPAFKETTMSIDWVHVSPFSR